MEAHGEAAEPEPVALRNVAFGDGEEAREARLGGEKVVERLVAGHGFVDPRAAAGHEEPARGVVERAEIHPVGQRQGAPREILGPRPVVLRRKLAEPVSEHEEARGEIAAVDRRDVSRLERIERPRVVPVQDVPSPALEALDGVKSSLEAREESVRLEPAEVVRGEVREEGEADVRGGGARRDQRRALVPRGGEIVRGETVRVLLDELLEVSPRLPRRRGEGSPGRRPRAPRARTGPRG